MGQEIGHGVEADGHGMQTVGVATRPMDDRVQDRGIAGDPGDSDRLGLQGAGGGKARAGDHGGEGALDDGHDPDDVGATLARDRQVVDVEDREVDPAGLEQLDRIGGGRRDQHAQANAAGSVKTPGDGRVDARVDGIRREVEHERRGGELTGAVARAGGDRARAEHERERGQRRPSVESAPGMRRRVTFSRNFTLSLSRTCRCYCKYCAFATHRPHLYPPDEVLRILDHAARRNVKELLVLTGERPEANSAVAKLLHEYGHEDFTSYVAWTCERALERGLLPHTNLGVLSREDLARLREVTASQGLMLESASERLMETVHAGSPTKHPARRLETIAAAGELRIPFTSGILVGIGETEQERMESLAALAELHERHGHIQEVILQNFVPHQRYYGQEPAEIADAAARDYWRTGVADGRPELPLPDWACPVDIEDMKRLIAE